jgi:hypothetical protein
MGETIMKTARLATGTKVGIALGTVALITLGVVMGYAIYAGGFSN